MTPTSAPDVRLEFHRDPGEFLAVAGEHLSGEPVVNTVVATTAQGAAATLAQGEVAPDRNWWLTVHDGSGAVVGCGMRSAPSPPYPAFLLCMPAAAAVALARELHDRGEDLPAVNGALPAVEKFAAEVARLRGGRVSVAQHTRLHRLEELLPPTPVAGRLAAATEDDLPLVTEWFAAFMDDADEQAGRPRGAGPHMMPGREELLRRIRGGRCWFWVNGAGECVHLTAANPPAFGVVRIGPVYTPPAHRGRGFASNAVAAVSRLAVAEGAQACLFTDQANPTSNKIYAALGYRPVVDMANLVID